MKRVVMVFVLVGCSKESDQSKIDLAELAVKKIALEAYPQWAMRNPTKDCPSSIDELAEFVNGKDQLIDPWKRPIEILCGPSAPPEIKGLGAMSLGPDGKKGTDDDIKSWARAK